MVQNKIGEALLLARVRQHIITYCEPLPQIIKTHGTNSIAQVTLTVGKCLSWIGPTLDQYSVVQALPGAAPVPRVADLGEQLRVLGLDIMHHPVKGELANTIATLKRQVELLQMLAKIQAEERSGAE